MQVLVFSRSGCVTLGHSVHLGAVGSEQYPHWAVVRIELIHEKLLEWWLALCKCPVSSPKGIHPSLPLTLSPLGCPAIQPPSLAQPGSRNLVSWYLISMKNCVEVIQSTGFKSIPSTYWLCDLEQVPQPF